MNVRVLTFFAASALFAADEQRVLLVQKALADYQRVFLSPAPQLGDTQSCIRSVAAMIPIATPDEAPQLHFEKGWCTLQEAAITHDAPLYREAASEFDQAVAAWPLQFTNPKKRPPEPAPAVFPVMAAVARLSGGAADTANLTAALSTHACPVSVMPAVHCEAILNAGREWQGYLDLERNDIAAAARDFPPSPWTDYARGKQLFRDRQYADAAAAYRRAIDAWKPNPIAPPLNLSDADADLGGAQLLAGDTRGALATLDQSLKLNPANARALFLRGRAHDVAGQNAAAIADYNLAARAAVAQAGEQSFGESNLYRGISFYRRKQYAQAEDEFANALNGEVPESLRADAAAWRRLAAVASGSCDVARRDLEAALPAASPFFPRDEARSLMDHCADTARK